MPTLLLFGSTGYFGSHFKRFFENQGWKVFGERIEITDLSAVKQAIQKYNPEVVMNATGKTGRPNVDWCEDHPAETIAINVCGVLNIAIACLELNKYFVHLGSGCVYSGDNQGQGFSEEDEPNFFGSLYSRTKAYSEKLLREFNPLQLRIRIPIETKPSPKNVIDKLVHYQKIISIPNSFTVVEDFLPASYKLITKRATGIFNMTNSGSMTQQYLMDKYQKIIDPDFKYEVISLNELSKSIKAPRSNTVLNTEKREKMGVFMPEIKERIVQILKNYKKNCHLL
jgi:dTDP-4-dehydrorhamnose reductase